MIMTELMTQKIRTRQRKEMDLMFIVMTLLLH